MKERNWTSVKEFILLGLTDEPKLQIPLFILFLLFYILTLLGNISIVALVTICPHLHTPMYFLLSNLAFVDLTYVSVITPKMLVNFLSETKAISRHACMMQLFFFSFMGSTDVFLLAAMAYDRYVAICNPLLYVAIMTKNTCLCLSGGAYSVAFMNAVVHTSCMFRLSFCGPNKITHFYCDVPPLLKLSCSDTLINVSVLVSVAGSFLISSFIIIIVSYIYIMSAIFRILSSEGRSRAFSTCSSHFFSVVLFYGTVFFMYLRPNSVYSMDQDRVASVFYTVVIPMLNPLIYALRNQEIIGALKNIMHSYDPLQTGLPISVSDSSGSGLNVCTTVNSGTEAEGIDPLQTGLPISVSDSSGSGLNVCTTVNSGTEAEGILPISRREAIWQQIVDKINSVEEVRRAVTECKKRWHDCKRRTKEKMARNRKAALQTGGGSPAHQEAMDHMEKMIAAVITEEIVTGIHGQDSADYHETMHMQGGHDPYTIGEVARFEDPNASSKCQIGDPVSYSRFGVRQSEE
ncbi:olfactory receptor 5AP2-like [Pleurodeles waltl]|uniref:olfactory receptor 5AP2-like n=1 Tax=Pleurodeles waltl TaxID=8319 RepID=UPI0037097E41